MEKPFIFFAFANSVDNPLPNLKEEERALLNMALNLKMDLGLIDFITPIQTTTDDFFHYIAKVGNKISILHFSGHADQVHLELDQSAKYSIDQFCGLIGGLSNLKLVFLNGCATKGMVEKLLDAEVKAVIATSRVVDDEEATKFSMAFYHAFSSKGKSLRFAFNQAVSTLAAQHRPAEPDKFIARSSMGRITQNKQDKDPIPWALYYRQQEEFVLDWQWINENAHPEFDEAMNLRIQTLRQDITQIKTKYKQFVLECNNMEAGLAAIAPDNPGYNTFKSLVEANKDQQKELQKELDQKLQLIKKEIDQHDSSKNAERLVTAINNLNYNPQIISFEKLYVHPFSAAAFVLQGSGSCGQDLLKDRLLDFAGIRFEFKEICIDFFSKVYKTPSSAKEIWDRLKIELEYPSEWTKAEVVEELVQGFYSLGQDIVMVFDKVNIAPPATGLPMIKGFWQQFLDLFQPMSKEEFPYRVLLFILDKQCSLLEKDGKYISDKDEKYQSTFAGPDGEKLNSHILPVIEPISASELNQWRIRQRIPLDLGLNEEVMKELAGAKGKFILPTIKGICEKVNLPNIYYARYHKLVYKVNL